MGRGGLQALAFQLDDPTEMHSMACLHQPLDFAPQNLDETVSVIEIEIDELPMLQSLRCERSPANEDERD